MRDDTPTVAAEEAHRAAHSPEPLPPDPADWFDCGFDTTRPAPALPPHLEQALTDSAAERARLERTFR